MVIDKIFDFFVGFFVVKWFFFLLLIVRVVYVILRGFFSIIKYLVFIEIYDKMIGVLIIIEIYKY